LPGNVAQLHNNERVTVGISDRLSNIRQHLPGAQRPVEDERLMQLFWNRAELKKELGLLQNQRHALFEQVKKHEAQIARAREQMEELEKYLGNPEVADHALVYFQLRALWRTCSERLSKFSSQLQQQQEERERRRQLIEFDQARRQRLAEFDRQLAEARAVADGLAGELHAMESRLASLRGFWNYFRRRKLTEEIVVTRANWDVAATRVTDLSDDREVIEQETAPAFPGISVDGRRTVNTAVIAYAQQLASLLAEGSLATLAKETTTKPVYDVKYGGREECTRLMRLLRDSHIELDEEKEDLAGLKERTDRLRSHVTYRNDADTVPLTDSIGTLTLSTEPVSGLETVNRTGINVLVDDYWDLYRALIQ
jgi:hypothetical protein